MQTPGKSVPSITRASSCEYVIALNEIFCLTLATTSGNPCLANKNHLARPLISQFPTHFAGC
jgi:hypothetical protein